MYIYKHLNKYNFKVKQEMVVPLELLQSSGLTLLDNGKYDDEEINGE